MLSKKKTAYKAHWTFIEPILITKTTTKCHTTYPLPLIGSKTILTTAQLDCKATHISAAKRHALEHDLKTDNISATPGACCINVRRDPAFTSAVHSTSGVISLDLRWTYVGRTASVGVGCPRNNHTYNYHWPLGRFYAATSPSDVDFTPELRRTSVTPRLVQLA